MILIDLTLEFLDFSSLNAASFPFLKSTETVRRSPKLKRVTA